MKGGKNPSQLTVQCVCYSTNDLNLSQIKDIWWKLENLKIKLVWTSWPAIIPFVLLIGQFRDSEAKLVLAS